MRFQTIRRTRSQLPERQRQQVLSGQRAGGMSGAGQLVAGCAAGRRRLTHSSVVADVGGGVPLKELAHDDGALLPRVVHNHPRRLLHRPLQRRQAHLPRAPSSLFASSPGARSASGRYQLGQNACMVRRHIFRTGWTDRSGCVHDWHQHCNKSALQLPFMHGALIEPPGHVAISVADRKRVRRNWRTCWSKLAIRPRSLKPASSPLDAYSSAVPPPAARPPRSSSLGRPPRVCRRRWAPLFPRDQNQTSAQWMSPGNILSHTTLLETHSRRRPCCSLQCAV